MAGRSFVWQSSSSAVATVDAQGLVTAVGNGTATIRAETGGVTGSVQITVNNDFDADGILNTLDACPNEAEVYNNWADTDGCPDDSLQLYALVTQLAQGYWQQVFSNGGRVYQPLGTVTPYSTAINTACGVMQPNNAFYCRANMGVYFHRPFLDNYLARIGDAAPAFILAHEVGHHVSNLLGWFSANVTPKQLELQADCYGGAFMRESAQRGWLEEGDLQEIVSALIVAGDPDWIWFNPTGHGTAEERVGAFLRGFLQGGVACPADSFAPFSMAPPDTYEMGPPLPPQAPGH